jgi:hypothetical protein
VGGADIGVCEWPSFLGTYRGGGMSRMSLSLSTPAANPERCHGGVTGVLKKFHGCVIEALHGCYMGIAWMSHGCYMLTAQHVLTQRRTHIHTHTHTHPPGGAGGPVAVVERILSFLYLCHTKRAMSMAKTATTTDTTAQAGATANPCCSRGRGGLGGGGGTPTPPPPPTCNSGCSRG